MALCASRVETFYRISSHKRRAVFHRHPKVLVDFDGFFFTLLAASHICGLQIFPISQRLSIARRPRYSPKLRHLHFCIRIKYPFALSPSVISRRPPSLALLYEFSQRGNSSREFRARSFFLFFLSFFFFFLFNISPSITHGRHERETNADTQGTLVLGNPLYYIIIVGRKTFRARARGRLFFSFFFPTFRLNIFYLEGLPDIIHRTSAKSPVLIENGVDALCLIYHYYFLYYYYYYYFFRNSLYNMIAVGQKSFRARACGSNLKNIFSLSSAQTFLISNPFRTSFIEFLRNFKFLRKPAATRYA